MQVISDPTCARTSMAEALKPVVLDDPKLLSKVFNRHDITAVMHASCNVETY